MLVFAVLILVWLLVHRLATLKARNVSRIFAVALLALAPRGASGVFASGILAKILHLCNYSS